MSYPFLYQQQQQQQQQQHHQQLGRLNQNYGLACSATNHNLTSSNPVIYKHQQQSSSNSHLQNQQFQHSALKNYNASNNNVYSNLKVKQITSAQPPIIPPSVLSKLANNYLPSGFKELNINNSNNNINIGSPKKSTKPCHFFIVV